MDFLKIITQVRFAAFLSEMVPTLWFNIRNRIYISKLISSLEYPKNPEAVGMQATIDKAPITKAVENSVDNFVHEQLDSIKHEFDKIFSQNSLSAEAISDLRKIQCIIDEAKKAEADIITSSFYSRLDKVLVKSSEAIEANKAFLEKYKGKEILPIKQVISDLDKILNSCREKLDFFSKKLSFIKKILEPVSGLTNLKKDSSKQVFRQWAEFFELFAEYLEEIIDIFKSIPLKTIEKSSKDILLLLSEKSYNNHKRDEYKRRLKFAVSYIITIIEEKDFDSDRELKRETYTIVKDLRTLTHAQYKISISQMKSQVNLHNIQALEEDDDEIVVDVDKIFQIMRDNGRTK